MQPNQDNRDYVNQDRPQEAERDAHRLVNNHLTVTLFTTTKQSDSTQIWFHVHTSREEANQALQEAPQGSFIIRPSSHRGAYAISWKDDNNTIQHSLIQHAVGRGYSLKIKERAEPDLYDTLTELVKNCSFLTNGLAEKRSNDAADQHSQSGPKTGEDMVKKLTSLIAENRPVLDSIAWTLHILEGANIGTMGALEKRTTLQFCHEEYCAPNLFTMTTAFATDIAEALKFNTTVKSLTIRGHYGFMRMHFTPHISNAEMVPLCDALLVNASITRLDLSANNISNEGAKLLANVLKTRQNLKSVILKHNFIGKEGLIALANTLLTNRRLDDIQISPQFVRAGIRGTEVNPVSDHFCRNLMALIEDTFKRKQELSYDSFRRSDGAPTSGSTFLSCFHGYLTALEAEKLLEHSPAGSYLFYLSDSRAHIILLCFKSPTGIPTHKAIYRHDYGFSFTRTRRDMPSLQQACAWALKGLPAIWSQAVGDQLFDDDLMEKIQPEFDMHPLWACLAVPEPEEKPSFAGDAYPTLRALVAKNTRFLSSPVNCSDMRILNAQFEALRPSSRPVSPGPGNVYTCTIDLPKQ